jgi:hypothetical protein
MKITRYNEPPAFPKPGKNLWLISTGKGWLCNGCFAVYRNRKEARQALKLKAYCLSKWRGPFKYIKEEKCQRKRKK